MIDQKSYTSAEKEISLLQLNIDNSGRIEDKTVSNIINKSKKILRKYFKTKLSLNTTQIPRGGKEDLNCDRHMQIFENHNIIPEYCFGCFKVLIEPKNVIDLIKLHLLFDSLKFDNENFRKCMIEGRKNIEGNYKGFIYCNNLDEAQQILEFVSEEIKNKINKDIICKIKRGCSEYVEIFPEYKNLGKNMMKYDTSWKTIENNFDKQNNTNRKSLIKHTWGVTIKDILIFENWITYAKTIGDESYKKIL